MFYHSTQRTPRAAYPSQLLKRRTLQRGYLVRGSQHCISLVPLRSTAPFADSETSSTNATSSDKLSALPGFQSSPALGRFYYGGTRTTPRRSFEASSSLPAIQSSPALNPMQRAPTPASQHSASESYGRDTPRQRVSFDSDRGAFPAALRNFKQGVCSL